jgi:hypothetical protein
MYEIAGNLNDRRALCSGFSSEYLWFKDFKMNKLYQVFSATALAMLLVTVSSQVVAGPVYEFSFESTAGTYLGPITGRIFGLPSTSGGIFAEATGVTIDTGPAAGVAAVFDVFSYNSFSLDSGEILSGELGAFSSTTEIFLDLCLNISSYCAGSSYGEVLDFDNGLVLASSDAIAFEQVPAPATGLLLAFGALYLRLRKAV